MPKAKINTFKSLAEPGSTEMHYGYICTVQEDGGLVAEIPEGMLQGEVEAGRAVAIAPEGDAFDAMDREALKAHLTSKSVDFARNAPDEKLRELCRAAE